MLLKKVVWFTHFCNYFIINQHNDLSLTTGNALIVIFTKLSVCHLDCSMSSVVHKMTHPRVEVSVYGEVAFCFAIDSTLRALWLHCPSTVRTLSSWLCFTNEKCFSHYNNMSSSSIQVHGQLPMLLQWAHFSSFCLGK